MDESNQTLDESLVDDEVHVDELPLATSGKRFANLLIDAICLYLILWVIAFTLRILGFRDFIVHLSSAGNRLELRLFTILIYVLYFTGLEAVFGKTIGKMITQTKVVDLQGRPISWTKALGRSLCRMIPFDAFSFFNNFPVGWHDSIPGTRVVTDR